MTELPRPSPQQLAAYDQAHAEAAELLDTLIAVHQIAARVSRELSVSALGWALLEERSPEDLASLLAVAVDRLTTTEAA